MSAKGEKYFFITSLAKGMKVLEVLSNNNALILSDLARLLGSNRATTHRFLATLQELGYVEKDYKERYRLSYKMLEVGRKAIDRHGIHQIARPYMLELSLSFNETINLGFFDGVDILHLDKIDSKEILRMDSPIGSRAPAYCTALGKAVLAFLPQHDLENYLSQTELKPIGPNTITSPQMLQKELERIRENGFSLDDEELSSGLRCIGAPVFDHHRAQPVYAMSVSGPSMRMTSEKIKKISQKIISETNKLSQEIKKIHF